jgi:hypothetical protein
VSYLTFNNGAAPSTPATDKMSVYADTSDKRIKAIDQYGVRGSLLDDAHYNFLANGGFWFAQRQVPGTDTTYSSVGGRVYAADRWWVSNESASVNYARVDTSGARETGLQARYYGRFTKITNATKLAFGQVIEGSDASSMSGRTMRFQLKLKADSARTFRLGVCQLTSAGTLDTIPSGANLFFTAWGASGTDPTLGSNLSYIAPKSGVTYPNGTVNGNAIDCSVTTAWTQFSIVFDVPSTAKNLVVMVWSNAGVTATTGIVSASEAMLVDEQVTSDWAPLSVQQELARCQRFYYKTFNVDQNPTTNVGLNTGELKFQGTVVGAVAFAGQGHRYPVQMRAAATTLTLYNPSAANAQIRNVTDSADMTGSAVTANGEQGCWVNGTGAAGNAAGEHLAVHLSADAEL